MSWLIVFGGSSAGALLWRRASYRSENHRTNTVMYFGPANFQQAGFQSAEGSIVATAVVGVVIVLMAVISIPLIE